MPFKPSITSPWKQIANLDSDLADYGLSLQSLFITFPGNDSLVRFWLDPWLTESPLCSVFPNLFALERTKHSTIKDRVDLAHNFGPLFSWSRLPSNLAEEDELAALTHLLSSYGFGSTEVDKWRWVATRSGVFSVRSLKSKAEASFSHAPNVPYVWNNWAPIKVNFFAWRILNNDVPTASNISRRGLPIQDLRCPFCNDFEESAIHLLGTCHFSSLVWDFVAHWCRLPPIFFMETNDIVSLPLSFRGSKTWIKCVQLIFLTSLWAIWRHRNEVIFDGKHPSADSVIGEIKSLGYLWLRNRSNLGDLNWSNWCTFSFAP